MSAYRSPERPCDAELAGGDDHEVRCPTCGGPIEIDWHLLGGKRHRALAVGMLARMKHETVCPGPPKAPPPFLRTRIAALLAWLLDR